VLGLCRRLLRHGQDAEDAFQATFLALARKADSIRSGEALAGWLRRVAYRAAVQARNAPRPATLPADESLAPAAGAEAPDPAQEVARRELQAALAEEVGRLPDHYRAVLVLCYLESRSNEEAARELGRPSAPSARGWRGPASGCAPG
jgi:RNA polymerase sigma factor (sigma-70 family)